MLVPLLVLGPLLLFATTGCEGCLQQVPVDAVAELPYPTCPSGELPKGEVTASGHLRAGPLSRDPHVVERFEVRRRDCLTVATVRQEWPGGTADVEVVYDPSGRPVRAWKRTTLPTAPNPSEHVDIRRYELRTRPLQMKIQRPGGSLAFRTLKGPTPAVAIGPGRGLLTLWIRRADLAVGQKVREHVLDFRSLGAERVQEVALRRDPDRQLASWPAPVRVYTVYGRESVFTDADNVVIGDLAGMRPHHTLDSDPPPALPMGDPPDPVNTP